MKNNNKILLKINKSWSDEFDINGFMAFDNFTQANSFVQDVITFSADDEEWVSFGGNYAVGEFTFRDFKFVEISDEAYSSLLGLFGDKGLIIYGIMSSIHYQWREDKILEEDKSISFHG
jgi:hypothetical protein